MNRLLGATVLGFIVLLLAGSGAPRTGSEALTRSPQAQAIGQDVERDSAAEALFAKIEAGITSGETARFSQDLARQTYVSVRGKESGYFSANQAFLIVRNYFSSRRLASFKLSKQESAGSMPFATGGGTFMSRGTLEQFQVYVALTRVESRWVIAQFNVY